MRTNKTFIPVQEEGKSFPVDLKKDTFSLTIDSQNKGQVFIPHLKHVVSMYQSKGLFFIELTSDSYLLVSETEFNRVKGLFV